MKLESGGEARASALQTSPRESSWAAASAEKRYSGPEGASNVSVHQNHQGVVQTPTLPGPVPRQSGSAGGRREGAESVRLRRSQGVLVPIQRLSCGLASRGGSSGRKSRCVDGRREDFPLGGAPQTRKCPLPSGGPVPRLCRGGQPPPRSGDLSASCRDLFTGLPS